MSRDAALQSLCRLVPADVVQRLLLGCQCEGQGGIVSDAGTDRIDSLAKLVYDKGGKHAFVLLMSGSFNPIHRSHLCTLIAAFEILSNYFKQDTNSQDCCIVAGSLAPSSDDWVQYKLGTAEAMPLQQRCDLCALALEDPEYSAFASRLFVTRYGIASGSSTCRRLSQEILQQHHKQTGSSAAPSPNVLPLYGSDYMVRQPSIMCYPGVIVARIDSEGSAESCLELLRSANCSGEYPVHPHFYFITASHVFHQGRTTPIQSPITNFPEECSSTLIRDLLRKATCQE